jgi:serine/threonine protein kinase
MRDVDAFEKKYQVGEGTYGSVFVARDRTSNEIVAMKRINTEQEENGFPITALREVKLLKGLGHPNMVILKECVCSKGTSRKTTTKKKFSMFCVVMLSFRTNKRDILVLIVMCVI